MQVNTPARSLADFLMPDFNLDALVPDMNYVNLIEKWATQEFEEVLFDDIDYAFGIYQQFPIILMQDPRFKASDVRA
jgi:hypothetical protein